MVDPPNPAAPNSTQSLRISINLNRMIRHEERSFTSKIEVQTLTPHVPTSSEIGNRWRSSGALRLNSGYIVLCLWRSTRTSPAGRWGVYGWLFCSRSGGDLVRSQRSRNRLGMLQRLMVRNFGGALRPRSACNVRGQKRRRTMLGGLNASPTLRANL